MAPEVGLEPTTSCLTDKCAANCATPELFSYGRDAGNRTHIAGLEDRGFIL